MTWSVAGPPATPRRLAATGATPRTTRRVTARRGGHRRRIASLAPNADAAGRDVLAAALVGGVVSGLPSTLGALLRGADPLQSSRAAGSLLIGEGRSDRALLAAAVPVHATLTLGWTALLARTLPRGREPAWGAVAGLAIAALDLGLIGRRAPSIAALSQPGQWADHVALGATVGVVLRRRRARRA